MLNSTRSLKLEEARHQAAQKHAEIIKGRQPAFSGIEREGQKEPFKGSAAAGICGLRSSCMLAPKPMSRVLIVASRDQAYPIVQELYREQPVPY